MNDVQSNVKHGFEIVGLNKNLNLLTNFVMGFQVSSISDHE